MGSVHPGLDSPGSFTHRPIAAAVHSSEGCRGHRHSGLIDGTRAFLLDASAIVPEPASLSLLTLAGATLLLRRHVAQRVREKARVHAA